MKIYFPNRVVAQPTGGNSTYAHELRRGLQALGVQVGVIPGRAGSALSPMTESVFGLLPLGADSVLHYSADTGPLVRSMVPSVVTVHGVASRWIDVARTPGQESRWRFRVSRALASVDRVITVSESSANDVASVFNVERGRITVIPHGVDHEKLGKPTRISDAIARLLPSRFVLYLGNIEPRKNLVELVRAFQVPEIRRSGVKLVIAGRRAWNFNESMDAILASDQVSYLDYVSDSDRVALMQSAELFVFPSLYEGFGMPVLEALAAGTPVVSSDRGALAEISGPAKVISDLTGSGIAAAILDGLSDSNWRSEIRVTGPEWARRFSWSTSVDAHLAEYTAARQR